MNYGELPLIVRLAFEKGMGQCSEDGLERALAYGREFLLDGEFTDHRIYNTTYCPMAATLDNVSDLTVTEIEKALRSAYGTDFNSNPIVTGDKEDDGRHYVIDFTDALNRMDQHQVREGIRAILERKRASRLPAE